jgi:hypothetical protein
MCCSLAVMIQHEGTKGTKASSSVQDASHSVPEEFHVEVDEQANTVTCKLEVGKKLGAVNGRKLFAGFYFYDYGALDQ